MTAPPGRPIVAAVDGSPSALHAVRWAAIEAARQHLPLRLVHVVNMSSVATSNGFMLPGGFVESLEAVGRACLADAETTVRKEHPKLQLEVVLQAGLPVAVLVDESDKAHLLVLGSRGLGGFTGILAGSTAVAVVAQGHCPVAVVRDSGPDHEPLTGGPVVVGVDGSPTSEAAIAWAYEEASWRAADLVAVHTWLEFGSDLDYSSAQPYVTDWNAVESEQRELLAERLAGYQEKYPDVTVRRVIATGRPVRQLLEQAVGAQLLVVGSRGHNALAGVLLGSTSQALIYHAPCPLLVVRPTAS